MTDRPLPDDPEDWPSDAHELLGVSHQADRNEVRRAYTRLVRIYKPEHEPEAFRLLRQAYEQALSWSEFNSRFATPEPVNESPQEPAASCSAAHPRRSVEELADEAWEQWQTDPAVVYRRLVELNERHPPCQDAYLRLYWALKLRPKLDAQTLPCEWVTRGLLACGASGPLRELYRRELLERPGEAISERSTQLVRSQSNPGTLVDLLIVRWRAAARLRQHQVIGQDLEALRPHWESADGETWLRLLLAALDELAWRVEAAEGSSFEQYGNEVNRMATLKPSQFDVLARFDMLRDLSLNFRRLDDFSNLSPELRELIARSWTVQPWELNVDAMRILADLARQPRELLDAFDQLQELSPGLLAQLGLLLDYAESSRERADPDWPAEELSRIVLELVDLSSWQEYHLFRSKLVQFCTEELVAPERAAQILQQQDRFWLNAERHLGQAVLEDWPLRYVYQAHRLLVT